MNPSSSSSVPLVPEDIKRLRLELKRRLPPEAFERQPLRGYVAFGLVPVTAALMGWVGTCELPVWASLLVSLVLGQLLTCLAFAAHEAMHHSMFHSRTLEHLLGWAGFAPLLVTPGNWKAWHVQAHHGATNIHLRDPDILPRRTDWLTQRFPKLLHTTLPGSRLLPSFISLSFLFTAQSQAFLWHYSGLPEYQHVHLRRTRERVLTVLLAGAWGAVGWALGPRGALFALVLPWLLCNLTLMLYISTQHWMQPAHDDDDNPFVNTASVTTHPFLDWLHFNFSYHQEHHIFPAQSPKYAPLLRQHLRELNPRASTVYPHGRALRLLFTRPALYSDDGGTLMAQDGSRAVHTTELRERLIPPGG